MKNTYSIEAIKKFIDDVITKYNIDRNELDNQGAVYYCNGNDSTAFDYTANGRTCEFYVYWKNGDGAIKTTVTEEIIHCYIYPQDNPYGGKYIEEEADQKMKEYANNLKAEGCAELNWMPGNHIVEMDWVII